MIWNRDYCVAYSRSFEREYRGRRPDITQQ